MVWRSAGADGASAVGALAAAAVGAAGGAGLAARGLPAQATAVTAARRTTRERMLGIRFSNGRAAAKIPQLQPAELPLLAPRAGLAPAHPAHSGGRRAPAASGAVHPPLATGRWSPAP